MEFFASRSAPMTSTRLVLFVYFWIAGSCPAVSRCDSFAEKSFPTYFKTHEDIVLLLVADRELALRLLVGCRKGLELLDRFILDDFDAKLHVAFCVLMAGL